MRAAGVEVVVFDQKDPVAYDSIFPDWFTVQRCPAVPDAVLTLFPMKYPSRRRERDDKIIEELRKSCKHLIDMRELEKEEEFLEGKGSVIYDLKNNKIYCCNSARASLNAINKYIEELNKISLKPWRAVVFTGKDKEGKVIYHTDCMLQIIKGRALVCAESLSKEQEEIVIRELTDPELNVESYEVVKISYEEVSHMCCNVFNVINNKGESVLLVSKQAFENYKREHLELLQKHYKLVVNDVTTIETLGGGSTRCLLAEYF